MRRVVKGGGGRVRTSESARRLESDGARRVIVEESGIRTLPSFMAKTNGGGSPENVPGFDIFRAVTAGFDTRRIAGPTFLTARPDGGFFSQSGTTTSLKSGSPAAKPENVIGADNRVMVPNTSVTPWRCVCHLEVEYESGPVGFGTGFLIGPKTVITAAHVLVDRTSNGWSKPRRARRVRVVPGRNGTMAPYGYFVADLRGCRIPAPWLEPNSVEGDAAVVDVAAIEIPDEYETEKLPTGERLGYFGLQTFASESAAEKARMLFINNAGYPHEADKPYGTLWYNAGRVREIRGAFVEYMVDTEGGQSGSPIYFFDEEKDQRYVVAIHTTGDFVNRGLRITPAVFDMIHAWTRG